MVDLVAPSEIEQLVGVERWRYEHVGLASRSGTFYILHSEECLRRLGSNLNECLFSEALDDMQREAHGVSGVWIPWRNYQNVPTLLELVTYGMNEGKGVPWHKLVPAQRLSRVYVPRHESLVRKYRS